MIYSHSRIGTYESCPQKYKFQYIDKIKSTITSIEAYLGSRVHDTFEHLYQSVSSGRLLTESETVTHYESVWDQHWDETIQIVVTGLRPDDYRTVGRRCVQDYYRHYQPFAAGRVLAIEKRVAITLDPDGRYLMQGFVDRIDKVGDGHFEIHDYKTNKSLPSQANQDHDRQLALYEIGLRAEVADITQVDLIWHFVRFDQEIRSRRSFGQLAELRSEMIDAIQQIEAATKCGDFPPRESSLCQWCAYRARCPLWAHQYAVEAQATDAPLLPDDGAVLVNKLADLAKRRKDLMGQIEAIQLEMDRLNESVIRYARLHALQRLCGDDREATVNRKTEWRFPTKSSDAPRYAQMLALLQQSPVWPALTEFSSRKLKRLLETPDGREIQTVLAALIEQEETWRVSLRKKSEKL